MKYIFLLCIAAPLLAFRPAPFKETVWAFETLIEKMDSLEKRIEELEKHEAKLSYTINPHGESNGAREERKI